MLGLLCLPLHQGKAVCGLFVRAAVKPPVTHCAPSPLPLLLHLPQAGCELGSDLIPLLVQHLTSQQPDTRAAAASALAHAVDTHPSTTSDSLAAVVALYGEDLEDDMDEARAAVLLDDAERAARDAARQQQAATRAGVAAALQALSGVLSPGPDVNTVLDFLVSRGLAEPDDRVREAMVGAGGCACVEGGRWVCCLQAAGMCGACGHVVSFTRIVMVSGQVPVVRAAAACPDHPAAAAAVP